MRAHRSTWCDHTSSIGHRPSKAMECSVETATWENCRDDFRLDGALIDLLVPGTGDVEWETFWTALKAGPFEPQAFRDGEPILLPDSAAWAIAEREVATVMARVQVGTVTAHCHFFGGDLELDIDPREVVGPAA